jgi:hypothetical protein
MKLFHLHKETFPTLPVPLCYRPNVTRTQNIEVEIPRRLTDTGTEKQILVIEDIDCAY